MVSNHSSHLLGHVICKNRICLDNGTYEFGSVLADLRAFRRGGSAGVDKAGLVLTGLEDTAVELARVVALIDALHGRVDVLVRQGTDLVLLAVLQDLVDVGLLLQRRDQVLRRLEHEVRLVLDEVHLVALLCLEVLIRWQLLVFGIKLNVLIEPRVPVLTSQRPAYLPIFLFVDHRSIGLWRVKVIEGHILEPLLPHGDLRLRVSYQHGLTDGSSLVVRRRLRY